MGHLYKLKFIDVPESSTLKKVKTSEQALMVLATVPENRAL